MHKQLHVLHRELQTDIASMRIMSVYKSNLLTLWDICLFWHSTSPSSQDLIPPLLQQVFGRSFSIDKDGPNNKGIWSIGLSPDGKLILYNNGKKVQNVTEVAGIQLNKVEENGKMVEKFTYACASDQDVRGDASRPLVCALNNARVCSSAPSMSTICLS